MKKTYSVLLDEQMVIEVQALCKKYDKSFSAMLRFLVLEGLVSQQPEEQKELFRDFMICKNAGVL